MRKAPTCSRCRHASSCPRPLCRSPHRLAKPCSDCLANRPQTPPRHKHMAVDKYRGYSIRTEYSEIWSAYLFAPGSDRPDPVVIRAPGNDGEQVLHERAKSLIDIWIKQKPLQQLEV